MQARARKLYLDCDGVLLGKTDPDDSRIVLANHAGEFLEYCLSNFQCYWLTTHCNQADITNVVNLFKKYADDSVMSLIVSIRPTRWRTFKTEAIDLSSDFYWIDDQPMAYELEALKNNNVLHRWLKVDTRREPDDLIRGLGLLKGAANVCR